MLASHALRLCMLGLVLINLLFVQLTEAAEPSWLMPLYLLTLLAPLLQPLRRWRAYRWVWNLAVVGLFGVLVSHAAGHDLRYVLQDGLLLAALCQVHLLNNLGDEQRPDLLFLNSFLIAVATGYLSSDLAYPFAFLLYVPLFVVGLQLLSVIGHGREVGAGDTRRIIVDGLWRSGVLVVATLAVFLFWPRDFHRRSLLAEEFDFTSPGETNEIDFSKKVKFKRRGRSKVSDRVVMTATLLQGNAIDVPMLWRGATLDTTDGREWWSSEGRDFAQAPIPADQWAQRGSQLVKTGAGSRFDTRLSVELMDVKVDLLFLPLAAERVIPGRGIHADRIRAAAGGTLAYGDRSEARTPPQYECAYASKREPYGGPVVREIASGWSRFVALPVSTRLKSARNLAARLVRDLDEDASQHELVMEFSDYLERKYEYLPPGADGAAETLDEFLSGAAGGHCEVFASALATMLRSQGVPCRLVTGYRSAEWDSEQRVLTFRSRGAHAWVEVYDPEAGWYAVDPNPAPAGAAGPSLFAKAKLRLSALWGKVAGFDAERRAWLVAWVRSLPARSAAWVRREPLQAILTLCAAMLAGLLVRLHRGRGMSRELRAYRSTLKRAGLRLGVGETPRELLVRVEVQGLVPKRLDELRQVTRAHERARYARARP